MYSDPSDCLPRLASSEKKLLAHPDAASSEKMEELKKQLEEAIK